MGHPFRLRRRDDKVDPDMRYRGLQLGFEVRMGSSARVLWYGDSPSSFPILGSWPAQSEQTIYIFPRSKGFSGGRLGERGDLEWRPGAGTVSRWRVVIQRLLTTGTCVCV